MGGREDTTKYTNEQHNSTQRYTKKRTHKRTNEYTHIASYIERNKLNKLIEYTTSKTPERNSTGVQLTYDRDIRVSSYPRDVKHRTCTPRHSLHKCYASNIIDNDKTQGAVASNSQGGTGGRRKKIKAV